MKIQKVVFIAYIILGIIIAWFIYDWTNPNYEKLFKQNSEEFAENRSQFEELIKNINSKYLCTKEKPNLTELSKKVTKEYQQKLDAIGIESVEISCGEELDCVEKITFIFNVKSGYNVRKLNSVQIIYSPCDKKTIKKFHQSSGHIDINGEGNNWLILSDTDFI
ncbi:hypothetical protein [Flavobacterium sp.]|uniref:hypothetical protein n=1 Tax=Flavobacterium sp. TaxID=239 RepID=UPI0026235FD4|nr:hypothetical protein [Flavobacterium sp.]